MFTGIVKAMGLVHRATRGAGGLRLEVDRGDLADPVEPGDSVCVAGVCLTHAPREGDGTERLAFDVVEETLRQTTLGTLSKGDRVNLEPSLTPSTPMGGHVVQGHVDAVGVVEHLSEGPDIQLVITLDEPWMAFVVPKGAIAVEGVSLTVASLHATGFGCALIDTTLRQTTLGQLLPGTKVNVETDILSRTVVHWLRRTREESESVTAETLRAAGFFKQ